MHTFETFEIYLWYFMSIFVNPSSAQCLDLVKSDNKPCDFYSLKQQKLYVKNATDVLHTDWDKKKNYSL